MAAITLTLLLPGKSVAVQSWTFESEQTIRVGRAADNDVVLYSAVVSRHHLELRREEEAWVAINLGANGTYYGSGNGGKACPQGWHGSTLSQFRPQNTD